MTTPDPGILRTFRLFTRVRLALVVFSILIYFLTAGRPPGRTWPFLAYALLDVIFLLVYLSMPRLEAALKQAYLPIAIGWASLGPLLQMHLVFFLFTGAVSERAIFFFVLQPILVLFIPLIIVSWRYSMRAVVLFSILTFVVDVLLLMYSYGKAGMAFLTPVVGMTFIRTVLFLLVGNMVAELVSVQREQQQRLVEANVRLAQYAATLEQLTVSRERNRMARELHDVMAHTMSGVAVELEGVRAMLKMDPERAETLLGQSLKAVREGLTETRRALQALRASPIEDLGLALAIRNLADSIAGRDGLQLDLQVESNIPDYPIDVQQVFYRVAQEALTNIVSHAQANRVSVRLQREGAFLMLAIGDNGVGFDDDVVDLSQKYGLLGMRERAEMINADLSITSQVGQGTRILLTYQAGALRPALKEAVNE